MTSGNTLRAGWALGLLLVPGLASAADLDLPTLLERVARNAGASVGFVEVRYSRLLKSPLVVTGTLERGDDGSLVRRVSSPYREATLIRGNDVVVEREGAPTRRFSLERAPELHGLLGSIDGMLRGDAGRLTQGFAATLDGSAERWRVRLVPRDERLRRRLEEISVYGADAAARCFAMRQSGGDASVIALAVAGPDDLPLAGRSQLEAWCREGPATVVR